MVAKQKHILSYEAKERRKKPNVLARLAAKFPWQVAATLWILGLFLLSLLAWLAALLVGIIHV